MTGRKVEHCESECGKLMSNARRLLSPHFGLRADVDEETRLYKLMNIQQRSFDIGRNDRLIKYFQRKKTRKKA